MKTGITVEQDGSQDDLLFASSNSDDPFAGFTANKAAAATQFTEKVVLDCINEYSDWEGDVTDSQSSGDQESTSY